MDTADWRTAHGLPLVLTDFVRNGTLVDRGDRAAATSSARCRPKRAADPVVLKRHVAPRPFD